MAEVVAKLQSLETAQEREQYLDFLGFKGEDPEPLPENKPASGEPPKIFFDSTSATVEWPSGISVRFFVGGSILWKYQDTNYTCAEIESLDSTLRIPPEYLELCFKHINEIHCKINQAMQESMKKLETQETKTRYIHSSKKKAFVAGMIMGRKENETRK